MSCLHHSIVALAVLLGSAVPTLAEDQADASVAIRSVLVAQGDAWNRGDLPGYLATYARSEDPRHVFNDEIPIGYPAIEARFRSRHPDPAKMGTISFSDLAVTVFAPDAAVAFAHWTFEDGERSLAGAFTLIFRLMEGQWVIVHDHSTAFPSG